MQKDNKLSDIVNTNPILIDVQRVFNGREAREVGFIYRTP